MRSTAYHTRISGLAAMSMLVALVVLVLAPHARATVLVVKSDDLPQYTAPVAGFTSRISKPALVINLGRSIEEGKKKLNTIASRTKVEAIFALGGQAVYLSRRVFPGVPLVFAMVLNRERVDLSGAITGVDVQLPVESLFARFKLLMPNLHSVGVIHGPTITDAALARVRRAASALQINVVTVTVRHADEVAGAYRRIRTQVDALWMVPDPVVVTRDNFGYLSHRARYDGIAFMAFSENFVRAGALMSISPSYETMGIQAAVLLDRLLDNLGSPPEVQAPLGSRLVVNADVATALGLDTASDLLGNADTLIDEGR